MRRQKEVGLSVLGSRKPWFESVPERNKAKDPAPLKIKEVWVEDRRLCRVSKRGRATKDAYDREAIVAHLKEPLRRGDKSLVANKGRRRIVCRHTSARDQAGNPELAEDRFCSAVKVELFFIGYF
jgi:hypothetical protein